MRLLLAIAVSGLSAIACHDDDDEVSGAPAADRGRPGWEHTLRPD